MEQGLIGMDGKHPTEKILLDNNLVSQLEQIIDHIKMLIHEYKLPCRIINAPNVSVNPHGCLNKLLIMSKSLRIFFYCLHHEQKNGKD